MHASISKKFASIELVSTPQGDKICGVVVKKEKNELFISHQQCGKDLSYLSEIPLKDCGTFLIFNNSQVIQKAVDSVEINDPKILYKSFPNLKMDEFYYQISKIGSGCLIAICRRKYIDETIGDYTKSGVKILGISLGLCSISNIEKFIVLDQFKTLNKIVALEPFSLTDHIDEVIVTYDINGLKVNNEAIIGFSQILGSVFTGDTSTGTIVAKNAYLKDDFKQSTLFKKLMKTILITVFTALFLNFIFFTYYFKKDSELSESVTLNENNIMQIDALKKSISAKESIIKKSFASMNSRSVPIISKIIYLIPDSILLDELSYQPMESSLKAETEISIRQNVILIEGKTSSPGEFTQWITQLEQSNCIKSVTITNFGQKAGNHSSFTLILEINNEIR